MCKQPVQVPSRAVVAIEQSTRELCDNHSHGARHEKLYCALDYLALEALRTVYTEARSAQSKWYEKGEHAARRPK